MTTKLSVQTSVLFSFANNPIFNFYLYSDLAAVIIKCCRAAELYLL